MLVAIPAGAAIAGILGMFIVVPALAVVAATWRTVLAVIGTRRNVAAHTAAVAAAPSRHPSHRTPSLRNPPRGTATRIAAYLPIAPPHIPPRSARSP